MKKSLGQIIQDIENVAYLRSVNEPALTREEAMGLLEDLKGELKDKVDSWINYSQAVDVALAHAEDQEKRWKEKKRSLEKIRAHMASYLMFQMQNGNYAELQGQDGRLKICKNSQPKLNITLPTQEIRFSHSLPVMAFQEISTLYPEFFQEIKLLNIDTISLKSAIKDGRKLEFANLEYGQHVRLL